MFRFSSEPNQMSSVECQLILVCDFAFALLDFLLGGFPEQVEIGLFTDFHIGIEISEIFAVIPIREFIFLKVVLSPSKSFIFYLLH